MIKEVDKEVMGHLNGWIIKARIYLIKIISLVIAFWLMVLMLLVGFGLPAYAISTWWKNKSQQVIDVKNPGNDQIKPVLKVEPQSESSNRWAESQNRKQVQAVAKKDLGLRGTLHESSSTVSEARSFVRSVSRFILGN